MKWGIIQPLTGGMYIGARNAIGSDASWILSYDGLTDVKKDANGNIISAGNEYNLLKWLTKHNINVPYYTFSHKMFEYVNNDDVNINGGKPDFNNIDIVVAVPVCSGLSKATIASSDTKDNRNCNMKFITDYTLGTIKPKIYIFENAPTLYKSTAAAPLREELNNIASKFGYSIVYYKTDTRFHNNPQKRPRTFVMFVKSEYAPVMHYEHILCNVPDYLSQIPKNATQQNQVVSMTGENILFLEFFRNYYGHNWRNNVPKWILQDIIDNNLWDNIFSFIDNYQMFDKQCNEKLKKHLEHIYNKVKMGKSYYSLLPQSGNTETTIACMFKNVPTYLHYSEDRLYNIREWLWLMGMPHDFELAGDININHPKLGQNVPVRTAEWIVKEAVRIINNDCEYTDKKVAFFDNTKTK